jgi:hypothetical protein
VRLFLFRCSAVILVVDGDVLCAGRLVESSSRAKTFLSMHFLVDAS